MYVIRTYDHAGKTLELSLPEKETEKLKGGMHAPSLKTAPGAGEIHFEEISASAETLQPGESVEVSIRIDGKNIAFIYFDVMLFDKERSQLYGPVFRHFIRAEREKETGGVLRPKWEKTNSVAYTYRPTLRLLTDGERTAFAFLIPESYGVASGKETWLLDGQYTFAGGGEQRRATLYFDGSGRMKKIIGFKAIGFRSTPGAITPSSGDSFSPFTQNLTLPAEEGDDWKEEKGMSNTLTFGENSLHWVEEMHLPGAHYIGFLVSDVDGNFTRKYIELTVSS